MAVALAWLLLPAGAARGAGPAAAVEPITAPPLVAGPADGAVQGGTTLYTAVRLSNTGKTAIRLLVVKTTSLHIGSLTKAGIVVTGGSSAIAAGRAGATYGAFPASALVPGTPTIEVVGSYRVGSTKQTFDFTLPLLVAPASPGSSPSTAGTVAFVFPSSTSFPHVSTAIAPEENQASGWVVPIGTSHPIVPSPEATFVEPATAERSQPAADAGKGLPAVQLYVNQHVVNTSPLIGVNTIAEPSGASSNTVSAGGVTMATFNSGAAYSLDVGLHWKPLDPTTIFQQSLPGQYLFCCDQVVHYVPSIDRFVWLLQYYNAVGNPNGPNIERVAIASPPAIIANAAVPAAAWSHFDITPTSVGQPNVGCTTSIGPSPCFDYPDVAVSGSFLYLSFDYTQAPNGGLEVIRVPLSDLVSEQGIVHIRYTTPSDSASAWGGHLLQQPKDTMYWVGEGSNSLLRVFSWPESSTSYSWQDLDIQSWPTGALVAGTPAPSVDWISAKNLPGNAVIGLTEAAGSAEGGGGDLLYFAWTGGIGSGFPHPQVEWVEVMASGGSLGIVAQRQLWSSAKSIVYPALATNAAGDVGFGVETGGSATFENFAVGLLASPTLFLTTTTSTAGTTRYGDYATVRRDFLQPKLFDALGYGIQKLAPQVDPHFVVFGRPPAPTYNQLTIAIYTGNDDAEGAEIRASLAGQKIPLCLKPSNDSSIAPDGVCASGSDAVAQDGTNHWDNFTFDGVSTYWLDTPQTSAAAFTSIELTLLQPDPTCEASCDNWDLQGITVKAIDSTGTLPPVTLLDVPPAAMSGDDCFARLKGTAQGNAGSVLISLSATSPTAPTHVYVGGIFDGETTTCSNNGD